MWPCHHIIASIVNYSQSYFYLIIIHKCEWKDSAQNKPNKRIDHERHYSY